MTPDPKARDLSSVGNRVSGWTAQRCLSERTSISKAFDIATGYFGAGALLALGGHWERLKRIRTLIGDEVSRRTGRSLLEAIRARAADALDSALQDGRVEDLFVSGVPAIVEALRSRQSAPTPERHTAL